MLKWCVVFQVISMFYIVFFVSNYIAMGIGVWIALCHGEILRQPLEHNDIKHEDCFYPWLEKPLVEQKEDSIVTDETQHFDFDGASIVKNPVQSVYNNTTSGLLRSGIKDHVVIDKEVPLEADQEESETEWYDPDRMPLFSSNRLIDQLVGMIRHDEADELTSIVTQLQEIHNMAMVADDNYYASEDAQFFITPHEEQYATTAICRPIVGRKRVQP